MAVRNRFSIFGSRSGQKSARFGFTQLAADFSKLRFALARCVKNDSFPLQVALSSNRMCEVKPAQDSTYPHAHYVVVFPSHQGQARIEESLEMFSLTMLLAREIAAITLGHAECHSISKNGTHTGSVPDIEHYHIYLFRDRNEKIETYARNVIPAWERIQEDRKRASGE